MKYRHSFHAGNFADVHKHTALLALLRALQRKDKGFLYIDTHAGAGSYALSASARNRGEARAGIAVLAAAPQLLAAELRDYRDAVDAWRRLNGDRGLYPGSPALAAQALRAQDRGVCCELVPPECRALERALGGFRRVRIECADGFGTLKAVLPARERRALALIDPPYEQASEWRRSQDALHLILERQRNAVVALWYPIKDDGADDLERLQRTLEVELLRLELWVYPRDARVGLNGSGLLIANPPYQFAAGAAAWQTELWQLLDPARRGGQSLHSRAAAADTPDRGAHVGA